ncbi:MAG: right-handed parallel beta-helix repeat-containing protein [Holophagales bacterium]|nr:right-handed parallel beta-helix repeat-containing protein [Holophagales bacterium]
MRFYLLLALLLSSPLSAAEHFVCDCAAGAEADCVPGDDGNPGAEALPWRSYEMARSAFASLSPGERIHFCRGGAWQVSGVGTRWVNRDCRAANPCVVGAYVPSWGSADDARPIFHRLDGTHGFSLADGGNAEHEEGYVFEALDVRSTSGSGNGFFLQNDIDDVTIRDVSISGFAIGVYLAGSNPCSADPDCDGRNERIVLQRSTILHNESQGWLGASNGSQILDSYFEGNGSLEVFDHNIYLSGSQGTPAHGMRVVGNRLYRSDLDGEGVCRGVSLVVHGEHVDLLIEGNEVWEDVGLAGPGCWGIAVDPGYSEAEAFLGVTIRGNVVRNVGNVGIGVASCGACVIENNIVIQENPFNSRAIAAPDRARAPNDHPMDAVVVRNNSIYIGADSGGTAIRLNGEGSGHVLASNAVYYAGSSSSFNCQDTDLPAGSYVDIDYNLCFRPFAPGAEWAHGMGSLQQWRAASGFDGHSSETDPGFADPVAGDLSPSGESAATVDSGHPTLSSPEAMGGVPRDDQPDLGSFEWGVGLVFADDFESGDLTAWAPF